MYLGQPAQLSKRGTEVRVTGGREVVLHEELFGRERTDASPPK